MNIKIKLRDNITILQFDEYTSSNLGCDDFVEAKNGILCHIKNDGYSVMFTFDEVWMPCADFDEIFELVI